MWLWIDRSGRPRFSLDPVNQVKSQTFEIPRDPELLMNLVSATRGRGALPELTGIDDPEQARIALRNQVQEKRDLEAREARAETERLGSRFRRNEPSTPPSPRDNAATASGPLRGVAYSRTSSALTRRRAFLSPAPRNTIRVGSVWGQASSTL